MGHRSGPCPVIEDWLHFCSNTYAVTLRSISCGEGAIPWPAASLQTMHNLVAIVFEQLYMASQRRRLEVIITVCCIFGTSVQLALQIFSGTWLYTNMKIFVCTWLWPTTTVLFIYPPSRSKYNKLPTSEVRNCWEPSMPEACKRGKEKKVFRTVLATEKCVRVKQEWENRKGEGTWYWSWKGPLSLPGPTLP